MNKDKDEEKDREEDEEFVEDLNLIKSILFNKL